ncbi:MAG: DUF4062 domain-containing protein [Pseudomonadota bacterium]
MDKRYQIFVSSTYTDLKDERQGVMQALMELDCIPAGMELFPAADEEQFNFIKKVIDDSDYYLLLIGGRYGSTTADGISYTEMEFDYAVSKGLKVIALIHGEPNNIPFGKSESDAELRQRLENFKEKVMDGRLVKFWKNTSELPGLVALSVSRAIKTYPAVGWARATSMPNEQMLIENRELQKQNENLKQSVRELKQKKAIAVPDIADLNSVYKFEGSYSSANAGRTGSYTFDITISWKNLFVLIAPYLVDHPNDVAVKQIFSRVLLEASGRSGHSARVNDQQFKTASIQLQAYGLVTVQYLKTTAGGHSLFWGLTDDGQRKMIEGRVIRSS